MTGDWLTFAKRDVAIECIPFADPTLVLSRRRQTQPRRTLPSAPSALLEGEA
jgi:hypothetical protein